MPNAACPAGPARPGPARYTATFIFAKKQFDDDFHRLDQAIATAAQRIDIAPDHADVRDRIWEGVPHKAVERVAFELLSNAIRHGARPIDVSARKDDGFEPMTRSHTSGAEPSCATSNMSRASPPTRVLSLWHAKQ